MPNVTTCTENVVLPTVSAGIVGKGQRLGYEPDYIIQHLSVCVALVKQLFLRNIPDLSWNW
jgi:hypothetical protein